VYRSASGLDFQGFTDTDITHTGITIPIATPITGRIGTTDTSTGLTIGTATTGFTAILGTTIIIAVKDSVAQ